MIGAFVQIGSHPLAGYVPTGTGCWEWVGSKTPNGYGKVRLGGRHRDFAHRVLYERAKGAIPPGLQIDHLCRNRACVNPDHLEAVSRKENVRRGNCPAMVRGRRNHCPAGHPFDESNNYVTPRGVRRCRVCRRLAARRAYHEAR